jgi:hypothetical protein
MFPAMSGTKHQFFLARAVAPLTTWGRSKKRSPANRNSALEKAVSGQYRFLTVLPVPWALLFVCLALPPAEVPARSAQPQMTVEELLDKVAEHAKQQNSKPPKREFIRTKITSELDKKSNVIKREELKYRMVIINGVLYPRLIQKNELALNPEEQRKEEEKEASFRIGGGKDAKKQEGHTILVKLSEETAKRFDYAITGREQVNGRMAHVVTVTPKPGLPAKTKEERVMSNLSGRLWIDESDYEIAKLDVHLTEPVYFGVAGLLGALHAFDFCLSRNRLSEGDWENSLVKVGIQFRMLLDTRRVQYEERISLLPPGGGTTSR